MSAFIVSHKTVCKALQGLIKLIDEGYSVPGLNLTKYSNEMQLDRLGADMVRLNHEAVRARYGEESTPQHFRYSLVSCTKVESYKALSCLLYQCCEGDLPETSELYKALERAKGVLASSIVHDLPDYESAKWGD